MPLSDSPQFGDDETRIEPDTHLEKVPRPSPLRDPRIMWAMFGLTIAVTVGLLGFNLYRLLDSVSAISGVVVTNSGQPIPAEIFILGTDEVYTADPTTGTFRIENVEAGLQTLIIGYGGVGKSVNVDVPFRREVLAGTVVLNISTD
jgi:hypothetical protein